MLTVATDSDEELQETTLVRSTTSPSEKVPVAVRRTDVPSASMGLSGVIAIDCNDAFVEVSVVEPLIPFNAAPMTLVPTPTVVTRPAWTVATDCVEELQVADSVRSWLVPSVKTPVAVSCSVVPLGVCGLIGVTAIASSVAAVPVTVVVPVTPVSVAVTAALPVLFAVASPAFPDALLTDTIELLELAQTTELVISTDCPLESSPVATS